MVMVVILTHEGVSARPDRNSFRVLMYLKVSICLFLFKENLGSLSTQFSMDDFLRKRGFHYFEGHSSECPEQVADLIKLTASSNLNVMQIGMNAGHSADTFLSNNPTLTLVSFDINEHDYTMPANDYLKKTYPGRHTLIVGDSTVEVPKYKGKPFDVIFIDGGHDYEVAKADLENSIKLSRKGTLIIMDDIASSGWTVGPTRAWNECKDIKQTGHSDYGLYRGMSWGLVTG